MEALNRHDRSLDEEGRFRLLVDAITDYAIYMLSPEGIITSWNTGAQRFKGYRPSEILGQHFSRFYLEEDRAAGIPARALATAEKHGRFEGEGWRQRKDGTCFWAHVIIDPIRRPSGELIGYAKITRDLTERRAAEKAIRQSEEQFRRLVQGVSDYAIYMLDPDGNVSSWNFGAERIKGYRPQEIIGRHFSTFYTPEDREAGVPQTALRLARAEGRFEREGWRVRKDGSRFWASVVIDVIRDDEGDVLGFAKITRDITEKMETQRALEQAREELFQSQKMEAIGQLTGGIAHDFNNLLMAVLGSLEILKKRMPRDLSLTSLVDNAMQGAQRGAALTQRMLAFSRRQELHMEPIDVSGLVRGMMDMLSRSLGPLTVIETSFPVRLPTILTDPNQLEMAILNLVVNARDAMPSGGRIVLRASEESLPSGKGPLSPGRYVRIAVIDEGEGMDAKTLEQAITPFFTTKGVGKGTGLGLSMVQGLASQSGGRLVMKSSLGEGTTAELWFPVATVEQGTEAAADRPQPEENASRRLRIVAVDDDGLVLMNTTLMLEDLGHTVFEAMAGPEALDILRKQQVDLVICDHAMPRMTGAQLAEAIRSEWPDMPIILATGYAEIPEGAGIVDLPRLGKPFSQAQLAEAISRIAS
ncbi:hybrid sensor histidine kinase/response regulator [Rhizobium ruizarguesonis]|uniref:hybrid sensor histidine kinase/response regulator n=1 Tax=Rhizobium ruizarguesonis TaxID=2081791 RepID=UPI001031F602|nr:PAS domain-containing sensor histidine kinase [Rhizobium ruizarguesonis]TCA35484.1 PAS domain-containing sensor histidine kinase [Rhizobium leguminosarum bv. viciae]TBA13968.1 PAS domain-containing sensor histidine kinase [Rhizobium ruizarguesonis]TBA34858.1 PAS domain-containing sensor histidine kinase [Rhizobium ruizarguesonis]TBA54267.1 PAS domain-containing sensor histidine kinase [Rhizobium ruizarguesonis]TBB59971.1 PAS domain-containing sensor histidine kinase [Rhizobium ruizarguesoni